MTGRDILYLSSIDWSFLWQGPQELALRLGAAGNRVLFVENTGVRAPRVRDARRVANRVRAWAGATPNRPSTVAPNVHVVSPLVFPPLGPPWRRRLNRAAFEWQIRRAMQALDFSADVIWTYLPTDTVEDVIGTFKRPHTRVVYYCVGEFALLASHPQRMIASERAVVAESDVVFASCDAIATRFAPINHNVHVFPFGVNAAAFADDATASSRQGAALDRLRALPRPIIGYSGGLHPIVDLDLMTAIARARPSWSWVYVGAIQRDDLAELAALPNVHLLGQRPHDELPALLRTFDVAIVPYRRAPVTETVVPTKINEYLAAGRSVVSTDLPTVRALESRRVLLTAPPDPGAFVAAIERALQLGDDPILVSQRRSVAAESDWGTRLAKMLALLHSEPTTGSESDGAASGRASLDLPGRRL